MLFGKYATQSTPTHTRCPQVEGEYVIDEGSGIEVTSEDGEHIATLSKGPCDVEVVARQGSRLRIVKPFEGYISLEN